MPAAGIYKGLEYESLHHYKASFAAADQKVWSKLLSNEAGFAAADQKALP